MRLLGLVAVGSFLFVAAPALAQNGDTPKKPDIGLDPYAATSACATPEQLQNDSVQLTREERVAFMTCLHARLAEQLNAKLPMKVDPQTTLVRASTDGPRFIYHMRVDVDAAAIPQATRDGVVATTRANVCKNADMRSTLEMGGAYGYIWSDRSGVEIARLNVDSC
jgi:hypothetical protein